MQSVEVKSSLGDALSYPDRHLGDEENAQLDADDGIIRHKKPEAGPLNKVRQKLRNWLNIEA